MKSIRMINRKKFYENVKFKDEESKKYLYKQILSFAFQNDMAKFEYITNYVSHALPFSYFNFETGNVFKITYPITISGTDLSNIEIVDAKCDVFHICLRFPSTIIYYERLNDCVVNLFIANHELNEHGGRFYSKRIRYIVQDL